MPVPAGRLAVVAVAALLAACASGPAPAPQASQPAGEPPADLTAAYRERAASGGIVYRLDPAQSQVRVHAFRGGAAARSGHNHVLTLPQFEGWLHLPGDDPAQARFDLRFAFADLAVDEPAQRAAIGGNFGGERSASDIEGTRRNLLRSFDAANFPQVHVQSVTVAGDWPVLAMEVAVTLHGATQRQWVALQVERSPAQVVATGALVIRHSDFGIAPYSVLGGLLAVQDPVVVTFRLGGTPQPAP